MRLSFLLWMMLVLGPAPAWCDEIGQVLERSHELRLAGLPDPALHTPAANALYHSFERLRRIGAVPANAELRVVATGAVAETLQGRVVVINVALGELPEICRLFLLAHELGHVDKLHWAQRIALYRGLIPGEVVQARTDAVLPQLGRAASMQSHDHEYQADAYAMRALLALGYGQGELLEMFFRLGNHGATATHPSTGKRLAHLRAIDREQRLSTAARTSEPGAASP